MTSNPPPSNLGPLSQPWARDITEQVVANRIALERLGGDFSNDGSLTNSTLDNISYQINELRQRQSGVVSLADVSTVNFRNPTITSNVITIQIPRPDVPRVGTVSVQLTAVNSNAAQSEVYVTMTADDIVFHRDSRSVPTQNLEPASWRGEKAFTGYTGFRAGPGFGGTISLLLQCEAIAGGSTTFRNVRFTNIQANYQYGQRV
ncbi:hypothetical protein SEA_JACKO_56 [Microbacterium phage Jacko]|nr:hypothetical protein SEA_JACKO_56 [Microbacterium phage Jacko]